MRRSHDCVVALSLFGGRCALKKSESEPDMDDMGLRCFQTVKGPLVSDRCL